MRVHGLNQVQCCRQPRSDLSGEVLPVVVVAYRRLRIGVARVGLSGAHVAVAGIKGGGDAGVPERMGRALTPASSPRSLITQYNPWPVMRWPLL